MENCALSSWSPVLFIFAAVCLCALSSYQLSVIRFVTLSVSQASWSGSLQLHAWLVKAIYPVSCYPPDVNPKSALTENETEHLSESLASSGSGFQCFATVHAATTSSSFL